MKCLNTFVAIGLVALLSACNTLPKPAPAPMLVLSVTGDEIRAEAPLCAGDWVTSVGVLFGPDSSSPAIRQGYESQNPAAENTIIAIDISEDTLQSGAIVNDVPVLQGLPSEFTPSVDEVRTVFSNTAYTTADFDLGALSQSENGPWLVTNSPNGDTVNVVASTQVDGEAALREFCAGRQ